jgi:CRAL/TRIO domain
LFRGSLLLEHLQFRGNLPLPGHDHLGRKVIVIRMAVHDPTKISPELVHKVSFMVWNVVFDEEEQMFTSGVVLIFDLDGFSIDHFIRMPIALAVKIMPCWEVLLLIKFLKNFF